MKKKCVMAVVSGLAILALATPLIAQEKIDETRDLKSDGTVVVSNVKGSVSVIGWDKKKVKVTGTLGEGSERLDIEGDKARLEIRVVIPHKAKNVEDTHLDIRVPRGSRIDISTVSADVSVDKFEGSMDVNTVSGDVEAGGRPEEVDVESVSGDIELMVESGEVSVNSVSGDVRLEKVHGDVDVETVSGDGWIEGGKFKRIQFNSVSGEIHFEGDLEKDGSYSFDSHSGDVELILPKKIDAEFEISTFSGDIDNDFGSRGERTSKYTPEKDLYFTVGSGDARVDVETFSGDVRLIKK